MTDKELIKLVKGGYDAWGGLNGLELVSMRYAFMWGYDSLDDRGQKIMDELNYRAEHGIPLSSRIRDALNH